jgi:prepilin-type N-terminal cleavage/methylation domain-containing protein
MQTADAQFPTARSDAGFSLPEMLISMGLMLVVLGGTFTAMANAFRTEQAARNITTMNTGMRAAMDLVVRDLTQVGQGLPIGRVLTVANGAGATLVRRPNPRGALAGSCPGVTTFNTSTADPNISAVNVGPNLGAPINGVCTDVITTFAIDSVFEGVAITSIPNATTLNVTNAVNISDSPDVNGDNVRVGDLVMVGDGSVAVLLAVTAKSGQTLTFATGDPLGINQTTPTLGTLNWIRGQIATPTISRVRMITYFVDSTTNPASPRLMRQLGSGTPMAVAFDLEASALNFDIADGVLNPAYVEMNATDKAPGGRCGSVACSEDQIRKVNVTMSMRSTTRDKSTGYYRNALTSQVALRSLAFVDRY